MFDGGHLRDWLHERLSAAISDVADIEPERLRFSEAEVIDSLVQKYSVEPLSFEWNSMTSSGMREATLRGNSQYPNSAFPAKAITIYVPVHGAVRLLQLRAQTFTMSGPPDASFSDGTLSFVLIGADLSAQDVRKRVEAMKETLENYAGWANRDVAEWAPNLRAAVAQATSQRKVRLDELAAANAALDIPLRAAGTAKQVQIPVARKTVRVAKKASGSGADALAEPQMSAAIYEDVIRTVRALANSLERLPRTARRFKEEEFRDLILFVLNSNYEGLARGEVFNGEGKTDILVPYDDHNAFIGECKFWTGPKKFNDAIDQLLGYTVWRDTKAAMLLFIKTGEPTAIVARADGVLREHPCFVSAKPATDSSSRADYLMHATDDPSRHIQVALQPVVIRQPDDD